VNSVSCVFVFLWHYSCWVCLFCFSKCISYLVLKLLGIVNTYLMNIQKFILEFFKLVIRILKNGTMISYSLGITRYILMWRSVTCQLLLLLVYAIWSAIESTRPGRQKRNRPICSTVIGIRRACFVVRKDCQTDRPRQLAKLRTTTCYLQRLVVFYIQRLICCFSGKVVMCIYLHVCTL
jgi:hypothetical protein